MLRIGAGRGSLHRLVKLSTPLSPESEKHPENIERLRRNPSQLLGHSEIIPHRIMLRDQPVFDLESMCLRDGETAPGGRKSVSHLPIGRVVHDEGSVLTRVQRDARHRSVTTHEDFMKLEAHIGEGRDAAIVSWPSEPADRDLVYPSARPNNDD
jgi:hypothetical protein